VLIVEDDPDGLMLFGRVISQIPADGVPVATAADARQAARVGEFDVLIVDHRLPDGDGVELAHEIRQASGCRVIVISGDYAPASGLPAGCDAWLTKPVNIVVLRDLVRLLIRQT
jgi:DNA-binding response OmpR family regulator